MERSKAGVFPWKQPPALALPHNLTFSNSTAQPVDGKNSLQKFIACQMKILQENIALYEIPGLRSENDISVLIL